MHFAGGAFYYAAECQTLRDMVRFFHEAWDHPSKELMCKIVDQKMLANIPADMTTKTIRKHFPQCEAQQPIPREASDRLFVSGEDVQVDIKVWANGSKALKHRRAFGRYVGALTAIDLATRYKIGKPIKSTGALEAELEALRVEIHGTAHTQDPTNRQPVLDGAGEDMGSPVRSPYRAAAVYTTRAPLYRRYREIPQDARRRSIQENVWEATPDCAVLGDGVYGLCNEVQHDG